MNPLFYRVTEVTEQTLPGIKGMIQQAVPELFPGVESDAALTEACGSETDFFFSRADRHELVWAIFLSQAWEPEFRAKILLQMPEVRNKVKEYRPHNPELFVFIFSTRLPDHGPAALADCPDTWTFFEYSFLGAGSKHALALKKMERLIANRLEIKPPGLQSGAEDESCLFRRGALSPAELDSLIDLSLALRGTA